MDGIIEISNLENKADFGKRQMGINIENILPALAESLYGNDWHVSIRELLQNSHDALTQREILEKNRSVNCLKESGSDVIPWTGSIHVWIDNRTEDKALIFQDDGIGLTSEEIHTYIATIGETGKKLADFPLTERKKLIGHFGIGFLAAFIIGKKVTVFSQSAIENSAPSAIAVFEGRTEYRNGTMQKKLPTGTIIRLSLKKEFSDASSYPNTYLLDSQKLEDAIRKCASNLPHKIFLHNSLKDTTGIWINSEGVPWEGQENVELDRFQRFITSRGELFGDIAYLSTFHFKADSDGVDAVGVIYIPKNPTGFRLQGKDDPSGGIRYPNILFVNNMHVVTGLPDFLPPWFLFAGVVVECPDLNLNLSRDSVIKNHNKYLQLREKISDSLLETCRNWVKTASFIECYNNNRDRFTASLIESANEDPLQALFSIFTPAIPFEVRSSRFGSGKMMNLEEYEKTAIEERDKEDKGELPKVPGELESRAGSTEELLYLYLLAKQDLGRLRAIAVQQRYPVILIQSETQKDTLHIYITLRRKQGQMNIMAINVSNIWTVDPISIDDRKRFNELKTMSEDIEARLCINEVKLGQFRPISVPAILLSATSSPKEAERIEAFLAESQDVLSLNVIKYLKSHSGQIRQGRSNFTLYLNVGNEYLQRLADYLNDHQGDPKTGPIVKDLLGEVVLNSAIPLFDDPGLTERLLSLRNVNALRIMTMLMDLSKNEMEITHLRAENSRRLDPKDAISLKDIPETVEKRTCAVLVLDLVKSTWMVGNVDLKDAGEIFSGFVDMVAEIVKKHEGHFDKFTGDGLIAEFFVSGEDLTFRQRAARSAFECSKALVDAVANFFQSEPRRCILADADLVGPKVRVAIAWGQVYFGRYCGIGTAVGAPMVQAARMCASKEFFRKTDDHAEYFVIGTNSIVDYAQMSHSETAERRIAKDWLIEGLGAMTIFGLYP